MKYLIIFLFSIFSFGLHAQTNTEATYIEILSQTRGWQFRISPTSEFQPVGFLGSNLEPYISDNLAAKDAFQGFQRGQKLIYIGTGGAIIGLGTFIYGIRNINEVAMLTSLGINSASVIMMLAGAIKTQNKIYETVDLFNFNKNPVSASLLPTIQPSSQSIGLGLVWQIK